MQNFRKPLLIIIAIAFLSAAVLSVMMLFSVNKIQAKFSVYGDSDAQEIQLKLDVFRGKNLIFLNIEDVAAIFDDYPYYEIKSITKEYPNVISLSVGKRAEIFQIENADKVYVIDKEGIVLNDTGETEFPRNVLSIDVGNLSVTDGSVGGKIVTSDDELFYSVLTTSQALYLNDSVESVEIIKSEYGNFRDAVFKTYTGVEITVWNVDDEGENKIIKAFECYEAISDYKKTAYYINAYKESDGEIVAEWTSHRGD